ncbi:MAG: DUF6527 family protein [Pseudobdellovibrionaceae bacterium]
MGKKVWKATNPKYPNQIEYIIKCPGCGNGHGFITSWDEEYKKKYADWYGIQGKQPHFPTWTFNGDMEKPTFSPSMLVDKDNPASRCHSFVREGKIQFLGDCFHALKNQTVDLPDVD